LRPTDAEPESRRVNVRSWPILFYYGGLVLRAPAGCGSISGLVEIGLGEEMIEL
jgi:hypothetical protein